MKKRVGIIIPTGMPGGVPLQALTLKDKFEAKYSEYELNILAPDCSKEWKDKIIKVDPYSITEKLKHLDILIMNVNYPTPPFIYDVYYAVKQLGIPFIPWVQTTGSVPRYRTYSDKLIQRNTSYTKSILEDSLSKMIIANSNSVKESIIRDFNVEDKEIKVIYNGIKVPSKGEHDLDFVQRDILYWGRLSPEKGVDTLIDAINVLKEDIPDISVSIYGNGPEESRYKFKTSYLDLNTNLVYEGYTSQKFLPEIIAKHKLMVIPSFTESFCNTAVESMLLKIPIVATKVEGLGEVLSGSNSVKYFKPGNPLSLQKSISEVLQNLDKYKQGLSETQDYARREFSPDRQAERFYNVLSDINIKRKNFSSKKIVTCDKPHDFIIHSY